MAVATPLRAIAFDMIGTTFPLAPLRPHLARLGLGEHALDLWFAQALRDVFGLAAAGDYRPFATVLRATLATMVPGADDDAALNPVFDAMAKLPAREGAEAAMAATREAGLTVIALTNGARDTTRGLLDHAGLSPLVDHIVSIDDVERSKPAPEIYRKAADVAGVAPGELALVAAHGWDINGAQAAGLHGAYLDADHPCSTALRQPDVSAPTLPDCVAALVTRFAKAEVTA